MGPGSQVLEAESPPTPTPAACQPETRERLWRDSPARRSENREGPCPRQRWVSTRLQQKQGPSPPPLGCHSGRQWLAWRPPAAGRAPSFTWRIG